MQCWQCTPNYRDKKFETESTKTYYTSFESFKPLDFKYVISQIVEVSPGFGRTDLCLPELPVMMNENYPPP